MAAEIHSVTNETERASLITVAVRKIISTNEQLHVQEHNCVSKLKTITSHYYFNPHVYAVHSVISDDDHESPA